MSNRPSEEYYRRLERERDERWLKLRGLYSPRSPMEQLPNHYRVTTAKPNPPLVHFAIPIDVDDLYKYAFKHDLVQYLKNFPNCVSSSASAIEAVKHLSKVVDYELTICWPFPYTSDCGLILELYNNYTLKEKILVNEDEEDVIQMVQTELGLGKSVQPRWYFDRFDEWQPGDEE